MKKRLYHIAHFIFFRGQLFQVLLLVLGLFFVSPTISYSQEGRKKTKLEKINNRKSVSQKKKKRKGDTPYSGRLNRNVQTNSSGQRRSSANYAKPNPFAGKKRSSEASAAKAAGRRSGTYSSMSSSKKGESISKGNAGGRNFRSFSSARKGVYPRQNPYMGRKRSTESSRARTASKYSGSYRSTSGGGSPSKKRINPYMGRKKRTESDRARSAARYKSNVRSLSGTAKPASRKRISSPIRSASARGHKVVQGGNPYSGRKKSSEASRARASARHKQPVRSISKNPERVSKGKVVSPRSISSSVRFNKAKNPYAFRDKRKWEQAHPKDLTGRRVKTNTQSVRPGPKIPSFNPYAGRKKMVDKPYEGKAGKAKVRTATRPSERSWKGDISGRKLRTKGKSSLQPTGGRTTVDPYYGRKRTGDKAYSGRMTFKGSRSASRPAESKPGVAMQNRTMSISAKGKGATAKSNLKNQYSRKPGGDKPYTGKMTFQGQRTATKPAESRPGKAMQNRNMSISSVGKGEKRKPTFNPYFSRGRRGDVAYSGKMSYKGRQSATRPAESKPGKPLQSRNMSISSEGKGEKRKPTFNPYFSRKKRGDQSYLGSLENPQVRSVSRSAKDVKRKTKFTGGRNLSITGENAGKWEKLPQKPRSKSARLATAFQGNEKSRKPLKGGGSVTTLWNNEGKPLTKKAPPRAAASATSFQGNIKMREPDKGGGTITRSWNNDGKALTKKAPSKIARSYASFQGNIKSRKPEKGGGTLTRDGWNNDAQPLKKEAVSPQIYYAARFQGTMKKKDQIKMNTDYKGYSGDMKVSNGKGKGYHPSFYNLTYKTRNSVKEKEKLVSIKLLWSKFFRSSNPHRQKPGKLEFDKGEQGMWYD